MSIGDNIRDLRESHNLTQRDLGDILGVSDKAVSTWEKGRAVPRMGVIQKMADYFGVSKTSIIEEPSDSIPLPPNVIRLTKARSIPILGTICAGNGIFCEENYEGRFAIDASIQADYAIHVRGDSMIGAGIFNGDLAFFRKDFDFQNGEIYALVTTDTNETTLKTVTTHDNLLILSPSNPSYPIITKEEDEVILIGELVGVYHPKK